MDEGDWVSTSSASPCNRQRKAPPGLSNGRFCRSCMSNNSLAPLLAVNGSPGSLLFVITVVDMVVVHITDHRRHHQGQYVNAGLPNEAQLVTLVEGLDREWRWVIDNLRPRAEAEVRATARGRCIDAQLHRRAAALTRCLGSARPSMGRRQRSSRWKAGRRGA